MNHEIQVSGCFEDEITIYQRMGADPLSWMLGWDLSEVEHKLMMTALYGYRDRSGVMNILGVNSGRFAHSKSYMKEDIKALIDIWDREVDKLVDLSIERERILVIDDDRDLYPYQREMQMSAYELVMSRELLSLDEWPIAIAPWEHKPKPIYEGKNHGAKPKFKPIPNARPFRRQHR